MDEAKAVRWNQKTYWATPCPRVPGYCYLKDVARHIYFVPESEFENNMDDLVADADWLYLNATEKSK